MVLTGWFEIFLFFLSLWLLPSGLLMTLFCFSFLLRQFDLGGDVHGDVFCACEAAHAVFVLFFFNHCILGERAWDIWTFMT